MRRPEVEAFVRRVAEATEPVWRPTGRPEWVWTYVSQSAELGANLADLTDDEWATYDARTQKLVWPSWDDVVSSLTREAMAPLRARHPVIHPSFGTILSPAEQRAQHDATVKLEKDAIATVEEVSRPVFERQ